MPGLKSICPRYSEDCEDNIFRIVARDMDNQMGSSNITLGAVIGIAIAGAAVVFVAAILLLVFHARRKDHRKRKQIAKHIQSTEEQVNFKSAIGPSTGNFDPSMPTSVVGGFEAYGGRGINDGIDAAQSIREPPMVKVRTSSESKNHFRLGVRDSWPLNNIPLALLPGQQPTMTLNQVAPPGYVVQPESKWPRRNSSRSSRSSRKSKTKVAVPSPEQHSYVPPSFVPPSRSPSKSPSRRPRNHRRSTSESQLNTILRSTSQRIKAAQKQTLTRTMTTFAKLPGSPPKERLPDPPLKQTNESSEVLIETSFFESPGSSVYEAFMAQTPSPDKPEGKETSHERDTSATSSIVSDDSLCEMATLDLVIPGLLTSPSKQSRTVAQKDSSTKNIPVPPDEPKEKDVPLAQRHRMTISNLDTASMQNKKSRVSTTAFGKHRSFQDINSGPSRISLAGDPFYSHVKSSKPVFPKTDLQGPRPLYVRKATFGQEATTERPLSYTSPLRDVSGNAQTPPKASGQQSSPSTYNADRNPFQWSPQEALQERPRGLSPKRNGSKRKGHKRSNVIRMSNLPSRPQSVLSVDVVPEEPEEDPSILKFNVPKIAPLRLVSPSKSPSPSPSAASRRQSGRPPSVPNFNPMLTIPDLSSPLSKPDNTSDVENHSPTASSPTLSTTNYYLEEEAGNSEEDFFAPNEPLNLPRKLSHHGRNHSETPRPPDIPPRAKTHRYSADAILHLSSPSKLTSFPPPKLSPKIALPRPPSNIIVSPSSLSASSPTLLAPPLLTMPIPGHLTGPRHQPSKLSPSPPPRESLHNSICMLRRMNSEVSHYSNGGSDTSPGLSPDLPFSRKFASSISYSPSIKQSSDISRMRSRGSKHYLSLGLSDQPSGQSIDRPRRGRTSITNSTSFKRSSRPMGIKGSRDSQDIFKDHRRRRMQSEFTEAELKTVREVASPPMVSNSPNALNFQFPVLSSTGSTDVNEEEEMDETPSKSRSQRWSDAMLKPAVESVRRESRMEYPSPRTPPIFHWDDKDLGAELGGMGGLEKNGNGTVFRGDGRSKKEGLSPGRPDSLGLYDEAGFLKSSPFKMRGGPGA